MRIAYVEEVNANAANDWNARAMDAKRAFMLTWLIQIDESERLISVGFVLL
jgi:hypothetical protein